ncbi:hypothetical protein A3D80_01040 [Candidatus Roizmanbacteria bacterium RIFCSPHIGHO2_02_FULL_40_13b]|uniref:Uncharacterized protein n=1 Tax=Candidatus Roizmanbacteria bacterium RIFCSPHIGHO2_01_FULL_39_24 TaxID=1802032 RepID=A0A1F7GNV0_9BACT|nr:MAG: hypothetical protein A2799_02695 [Candidatus Roizmanbacteria bacterium RIFCSPHIGHO2_01_FULL_39_24]OGK26281.1 MAG: hypothetical protein A3D80_01040 [Candidatus Roizmanbacteria bacterium RIFCSPHIGHO2_02_FULL_40_13b]OGK49344.1 MAG: hypothetical protein A3A56_03670 [Candidatus Roizmanbacteria bacterium RIFCSPLOWO2_01_FULL_40_32]
MKQFNNVTIKYPLILGAVILLLFIFLQPKLSVQLFPFKRQMIWNEFATSVKTAGQIDGRTFWQFREFYYPGYFTFDRLGLSKQKVSVAEVKLNVELLPEASASAFLIYKSDKVNSLEALVNTDDLSATISDKDFTNENVLLQNTSNLIYLSSKKARISFIKPIDEMVTANGYYDYKNPQDKALIDGKYWLSVTEVELD